MAKKREMPPNLVEESFKAGYNRDQSLSAQEEPENVPKIVTEERTQRVVSNAAMGYQIIEERKREKRDKRINVVLKPSTNDKLDQYVEDGIIKSKNDLINQLLEIFIKEQG